MSRGIPLEKAKELLIMGFIEKFKEELPMEYAVELNSLMRMSEVIKDVLKIYGCNSIYEYLDLKFSKNNKQENDNSQEKSSTKK